MAPNGSQPTDGETIVRIPTKVPTGSRVSLSAGTELYEGASVVGTPETMFGVIVVVSAGTVLADGDYVVGIMLELTFRCSVVMADGSNTVD